MVWRGGSACFCVRSVLVTGHIFPLSRTRVPIVPRFSLHGQAARPARYTCRCSRLGTILLHVWMPLSTLFNYWSACMATAASPRQMMYAQIMSQPALLLEVF